MALSQAYYEWEEKTKQEAKAEVALKLLRMGLSAEQVAEGTDPPLPESNSSKSNSLGTNSRFGGT